MKFTEYIFWIAFALTLYTYLLYPITLWIVCRVTPIRRSGRRLVEAQHEVSEIKGRAIEQWPQVSLLIPAFNEERQLPAKIANCEQIDYPLDRMEIILVSDGSTDGTDTLLEDLEPPRFRHLRLPTREGKPSALNAGVSRAKGEIIVFSDASTRFHPMAVRRLVQHFRDPRVGAVCGAPEFKRTAESAATEGVYWNYETALRRMEGRIGATLTASGTIYAVRRSCFRPLDLATILDDFVIPITARRLGYQVAYEPEARAWEQAPDRVGDEFKRRARLAAGGFSALGLLFRATLPNPLLFWVFVSHKLLRWLIPLFLLAMAGAGLVLVANPFYRHLLEAQAALYLWAAAGLLFPRQLSKIRFGLIGYFLVAMNAALLVGLARWALDRQPVTWTRVGG